MKNVDMGKDGHPPVNGLCLLCRSNRIDRCHIKSKGSGGPDDNWNIMFLCRFHHQEQHRIGIITFYKKYPNIQKALQFAGWSLDESSGKPRLVHPKLAPAE